MKNLKRFLTKASSISIMGVFMLLAISGSAFAMQNGTGEDFPNDRCSLVRKDGSIHSGKCSTVCKGKTVYDDPTREYGNGSYCEEASASYRPQKPFNIFTPGGTFSKIQPKSGKFAPATKNNRYKAFRR